MHNIHAGLIINQNMQFTVSFIKSVLFWMQLAIVVCYLHALVSCMHAECTDLVQVNLLKQCRAVHKSVSSQSKLFSLVGTAIYNYYRVSM